MAQLYDSDLIPAGLARRLAAMLYDSLLLIAVLMAVTAIVLALHRGPVDYTHPLYRLLLLAVIFIFFGGFWTHGGQTLGMRTWHLRVQNLDGTPLTWSRSLIRFLAAIPSVLFMGAGFLWVLVDRDHMAWHDRLSKSVIVRITKRHRTQP